MRTQRIGRYEVLETLASGGMGVVYKARDPLIDRVVAIKTLGAGLSPIEAETFRKRFAREAKSAGRLNHPNIVTIHDMGESDDGGAYIAMEFLEGRTLRDILDSGVVMSAATVADIGIQIAEGLAFAHRNDVVHCDVKPANVMVLGNGTVKLMDFGIARLPTGSRTFAGNVLGSPRYISPEQIVGRPIDARSDVFGLGAVLYEMLTGVPPFTGTAIDEILYQVINEKPAPPSKRNPALPVAFDEIVERAMAKHPDDRYPGAQQVAGALRKLASDFDDAARVLPPLPATAARTAAPDAKTVELPPASATPLPAAAGARRPRRTLGIAAVAALLVIAAIATLLRRADDEASGPMVGTMVDKSTINGAAAADRAVREVARPAVIPPLVTTPPAEKSAPAAPAMESNTVPAPATVPVTVAADGSKGEGRVGLAISPWGEVFVDGRRRGVTPPLSELRLPAGTYVVEIRNAGFAPITRTIEVAPDRTLRIKHKFQ